MKTFKPISPEEKRTILHAELEIERISNGIDDIEDNLEYWDAIKKIQVENTKMPEFIELKKKFLDTDNQMRDICRKALNILDKSDKYREELVKMSLRGAGEISETYESYWDEVTRNELMNFVESLKYVMPIFEMKQDYELLIISDERKEK